MTPNEAHRTATPLELLYDLTFVVAFGTAANELAHYVAAGHIGAGVGGFALATFAVSWAWVNYSWFASAYDQDDVLYRLLWHRRVPPGVVHLTGNQERVQAFLRSRLTP